MRYSNRNPKRICPDTNSYLEPQRGCGFSTLPGPVEPHQGLSILYDPSPEFWLVRCGGNQRGLLPLSSHHPPGWYQHVLAFIGASHSRLRSQCSRHRSPARLSFRRLSPHRCWHGRLLTGTARSTSCRMRHARLTTMENLDLPDLDEPLSQSAAANRTLAGAGGALPGHRILAAGEIGAGFVKSSLDSGMKIRPNPHYDVFLAEFQKRKRLFSNWRGIA